jgi:hypothetical protein
MSTYQLHSTGYLVSRSFAVFNYWHNSNTNSTQQTAPNLRSNPKNTCKHLDIPLLIMKAVGKPLSRLLAWPSISHRMHAILRLWNPERPYTECLPVLSKRRASSVDVLATIQYLARNSQAVNSFPIQDDGKFCKHQVCWRS